MIHVTVEIRVKPRLSKNVSLSTFSAEAWKIGWF